ncbi:MULTISPECIES: hypothetical protein [unclassified Paraburkholderia]|nr:MULTISPECIES: hypothetical protein [unclassified Paraburkholderia]
MDTIMGSSPGHPEVELPAAHNVAVFYIGLIIATVYVRDAVFEQRES